MASSTVYQSVLELHLNRPLAASHSRGTKPPRWRTKVALRRDKQRKLPLQIMYVFCLSCPSATFALPRDGFVPRGWLAAKGLLFISMIDFPVIRDPCYAQRILGLLGGEHCESLQRNVWRNVVFPSNSVFRCRITYFRRDFVRSGGD